MNNENPSTDLMKAYPVLRPEKAPNLLRIIDSNFNGKGPLVLDLLRIRPGTGGVLHYIITTLEGGRCART
jgi:hypothetical protein